MVMAKLEISAVELNLSESMKEAQPSPPPAAPTEPEPARPEPEMVPETEPEPVLQPPGSRVKPEFKPQPIPEPEAVVIPDVKPDPPEMTPPEQEPPQAEPPRPKMPPPPGVQPAVEKPVKSPPAVVAPAPEQPESTTPESGAAAAMIDQPPKPQRAIKPRYPSGARRRGEEGTVTLKVKISATGRTREVSVLNPSGFAELDDAAKRAVREARFTPGKYNGKTVESEAQLTIIFKLR